MTKKIDFIIMTKKATQVKKKTPKSKIPQYIWECEGFLGYCTGSPLRKK